MLYTARAGWGSCCNVQLSVVVTDVCGGGRKWPNEDDCSARHSAGLIAIYFISFTSSQIPNLSASVAVNQTSCGGNKYLRMSLSDNPVHFL